jgi:hypothetical protein
MDNWQLDFLIKSLPDLYSLHIPMERIKILNRSFNILIT